MTDSLHAKEANLSKQVAEMQGRIDSLENILNQGKDVLTPKRQQSLWASPAVHCTS